MGRSKKLNEIEIVKIIIKIKQLKQDTLGWFATYSTLCFRQDLNFVGKLLFQITPPRDFLQLQTLFFSSYFTQLTQVHILHMYYCVVHIVKENLFLFPLRLRTTPNTTCFFKAMQLKLIQLESLCERLETLMMM